ncbi:hypothetical protein ACRRTK_017666 [Alexandromys fortis]
MHAGLNIYETEGTLLDLVREPILQWSLGSKMSEALVKQLYPHVTDIRVAKCPCANDVALLGFILNSTYNADYVTITFDRNMTLSESSKRTFVSVSVFKNEKPSIQPKFPNFHFPASFSNPVGMVFHPRTHFLYVYGDEVWLSMDGGNTFERLCDFPSNFVRKTVHCFYSSSISFITQNGMIYMTKADVLDSVLFNTHNCNAKEGSACFGFADEVDTAQVTET